MKLILLIIVELKLFLKATNKVYGCKISRADHLINKETGKFDAEEYEKHPERYQSTFYREVRDCNTFNLQDLHSQVLLLMAFIGRQIHQNY